MRIGLDATTLIALGAIGELGLLTTLDGDLVAPLAVADEVTTEPAQTNLERFLAGGATTARPDVRDDHREQARELLGDEETSGDTALIALVLAETAPNRPVGVVSDDRRVRTVADGLGATVTGTVGVVVRAVEDRGMDAAAGKDLVRRLDSHGLHMTGELREAAYELIAEATEEW